MLIELAKDIRQEFIVFVDDLLLFLVQMLEWKETNIMNMQIVFSAFSWLFKYLQKYMKIDDIKKYYKTYFVRFIANKNYYIRDFMAEIFASIFRSKILLNYQLTTDSMQNDDDDDKKDDKEKGHVFNDNDKILMLRNDILSINIRDFLFETKQIKDSNKKRQALQIGLSVFLFQLIRGIMKGFHSKTIDILPLIFSVLRRQRIDEIDDEGLIQRENEEIEHQM